MAAFQIASEARWNLRASAISATHTLFHVLGVAQWRFFKGNSAARQALHVVATLRAMVIVQHGKTQIFHVQRQSVPHNQHEQRRAQQGKDQAYRIAQRSGFRARQFPPRRRS